MLHENYSLKILGEGAYSVVYISYNDKNEFKAHKKINYV